MEIKVSGLDKNKNAYLVIDDKLPTGLVPINQNLKNAKNKNNESYFYSYAYPEYTKNGVILYRDFVDSDTMVFYYQAKAVSSGNFIAPPTTAELMYNPEVYARTRVQNLQIDEVSQIESLKEKKRELVGIIKNQLNNTFSDKEKIALIIILVGFISVFSY